MKILFVLRLYSGFQASIGEGQWNPAGVPVIYKLLEAFENTSCERRIVFTCKGETAVCAGKGDRKVIVQGLSGDIFVLAGKSRFPRFLGRLRDYLCEARQARQAFRHCRAFQPDLVYVDRGNKWTAGLLARFLDVPVVYHVMGISPGFRHIMAGNRPSQVLSRWLVRSPFATVVCTQDGSGGEFWLDRMLRPDVPRVMLMNAVDPVTETAAPAPAAPGPTTILFVARLEHLKGCDEFVTAMLSTWRRQPEALRAVVVGGGNRYEALRQRVIDAGAQDAITFTGEIPHAEVLEHYRWADVYVSLNRMCNLTATNVEAMAAGCCCVFPASQPDIGADLETDRLFPAHTILRIPSVEDTEALADALLELHHKPEERLARARGTLALAREIVPSWERRMAREVSLLEALAGATGAAR